ncbi:MAG: thioredoxin reductase, partial [Thermodesulfobacteriota bacterium]|nr:thioredoxin reductase [Thermodesulfobacteriota bacterium]
MRGLFAGMRDPVSLEVFTKDAQNDSYNEAVIRFARDLDRLGDKVKVSFHKIGEERSEELKVFRSPTILIEPDKYPIRYTGAPLGEEARTFIGTIMLISKGESGLSEISLALLATLEETRHIRVFVSP